MLRSMLSLMAPKLGFAGHPKRTNVDVVPPSRVNDVERLRRLLEDIYHSGALNPLDASDAEHMRLLDVVLAAAEGRTFDDLGLPFPRQRAERGGGVVTLPALPVGWVYVAVPASEALLDSGPTCGVQ